MKRLALVLLGTLLLLLSLSCSASPKQEGSTTNTLAPTTTSVTRPTIPPSAGGGSGEAPSLDRMIVQTAQMSLIVENIGNTIDKISQLAVTRQGFVVSSNSWRDGQRLHGTISIRIPAADFGNVMQTITGMAVEVVSQTTSSKDVTEEYVDLTARLKTLEASEQQLLVILQKAEKVEDILAVQRELTNVRSLIEQTKGRMQYLEKTSSTSLIQVNLEQSQLVAKFTANNRFVRAGESVRFVSQVAGGFPPYSYQWEFGDGKKSNEPSPSHAFGSSGSYTIRLKITDDRGNTDTATLPDYITVASGWSPGSVLQAAWNALIIFLKTLFNVLIWLLIFSPIWGGIWALTYWLVRRNRRKKG